MTSSGKRSRTHRVLVRSLCAVGLSASACIVPLGITTAAAAAVQQLGTVFVGMPVNAPVPAGGAAPGTTHSWQRCNYWATLAEYDGTFQMYPLGDTGTTAENALNARPSAARYIGAHTLASDGPLTDQGREGSHFDGKTSAVSVPEASDPGNGLPFSIEIWARPEKVDGTYRYLYSHERTRAGNLRQGTGIWLSTAGLGFERWIEGRGAFVTYAPGLPIGRWSQVLASFDGTTMRLYVNGVQVGSRQTSGAVGSIPLPSYIGAGTAGHSGFFAGDLADTVLYLPAVPRAHVAAQYAAATAPPCQAIPGASAASYTPTIADLGQVLLASSTAGGTTLTAQDREAVMYDKQSQAVAVGFINDLTEGQTLSGAFPVTASLFGQLASRVSFEVDGHVGYAKTGEPPYQYMWDTTAVANGPHVVELTVVGPGGFGTTHTGLTVNVQN